MNPVKCLERVAVLLALVSLMAATRMLAQPRFEIPLTVSDGGVTWTLYFGILPGAHFCIEALDGINGHREFPIPIGPVWGVFDARFMCPRSAASGCNYCYEQGALCDYRPFISYAQKDTFKVKTMMGQGTAMVISWQAGLSARFTHLTLRYFDQVQGANVNINMLTDTMVNVTDAGDPATVTIYAGELLLSVEEVSRDVPQTFVLHQNYPNPFNPSTKIGFGIQGTGFVSLKVYDVLGREVATLVDRRQEPGEHSAEWNPEGLPSGVYIYRLTTASATTAKKMLLLR